MPLVRAVYYSPALMLGCRWGALHFFSMPFATARAILCAVSSAFLFGCASRPFFGSPVVSRKGSSVLFFGALPFLSNLFHLLHFFGCRDWGAQAQRIGMWKAITWQSAVPCS